MKKFFGLFAVLLITIPVIAQYKIQKVSSNINTVSEGFYYSLPQTVIRIDLTLERIDQKPGPLANYSSDFLGTTNYIEKANTEYNLIDVNILSFAEVDPGQIYFLQFPVQKSKESVTTSFQLSDIGTLISYNGKDEINSKPQFSSTLNQTNLYYQTDEKFNYFADYNRKKVIDTVVRKITIDTVTIDRFMFRTNWVNLSEKDKANEAALKIQNIRDQRFNLLTGFQEVNYNGSIEYMDFQLKKMENEYLQLFLGKEIRSVETYTVYVVVNKGEKTKTVLKTENGNSIDVQFKPQGNTELLPEKPLQKDDHLYYRIPENTVVNVVFKNKIEKSVNIPISQLGKLSMAPLDNTQLYFNAQTGNLIKMVKTQ